MQSNTSLNRTTHPQGVHQKSVKMKLGADLLERLPKRAAVLRPSRISVFRPSVWTVGLKDLHPMKFVLLRRGRLAWRWAEKNIAFTH